MFTIGEELAAIRSISYHSDDTKLFKALCDCLTADEYEDLKASKLGVFIKFKELGFGWTSRMFEHLTGLNCDYTKDLENPRCEVTKEMAAFWENMCVNLDTGPIEDPAVDNIIKVMFNDPGLKWTMDCWKVTGTHKVVKMEVSPAKNEVSSVKTEATTVKSESVVKEESSRPRKKALTGTHKVVKMEVSPAKNEVSSVKTEATTVKSESVVKEESSRPRKKARKGIKLLGDRMGDVEKMITKKGSSSDDLQLTTTSNPPKPVHEPGSESVNGAKAGQNEAKEHSVTTEPSSSTELCLVKPADDLPSDEPSVLILDKQVSTASDLLLEEARRQTKKETAMVNLREKSERERKLAPTQQTPFKGNITAKQIIPNKKVGRGYDPFAPYDKKKSKELTEWLEQDPSYKLPLKKNHVDVQVGFIMSSEPP
uniref:DUF1985 domain-containing protein n=1 Tax=Brassica oleracea var. oleracea TaxID=109376 RepID=A0A0D3CHK5_BRAOL